MIRTVGVIGLGLIGGSMARALKKYTDYTVKGYDIKEDVTAMALSDGSIDGVISPDSVGGGLPLTDCDMLIVALYPAAAREFVIRHADELRSGTLIVDCCGVKGEICRALSPLCHEKGLFFVGGHPMAGIERSGYESSFADLFKGASMILCRDGYTSEEAIRTAEDVFLSVGFGRISLSTPDEHDRIIAFTSQLAHVASSAYIKSDTASSQMGFSAGSYKDLTRVARLDEIMWSELFLENRTHLLREIDELVEHLIEYKTVIEDGDRDTLITLLRDGRIAKEKLG